jgi:iron complex outermembrane recepter protein
MVLKSGAYLSLSRTVGLIAWVTGVTVAQAIAQTPPGSPTESVQTTQPRAATPQSGEDTMADIVVTAQRRSESVQKVPIAVTALNGEALQDRGDVTVASLAEEVPNLNVSEQIGQARLTIRGIGVDDISVGSEGSVAFNQDGVFYSRSAAALASFYDVDRVEVLRGPQGTLYGRNSTGGSVNIITNRPTDDFRAGVELTGGNYETINSQGFVSGALAAGVDGRISFQTQHHDGYGRNIETGNDIDNKDSQAVRAQLLFKLTDRLNVLLAGDYYRSDDRSNGYHYFGAGGVAPNGSVITPSGNLLGGTPASDIRDINSPFDPTARAHFYGGRIDVSYGLSDSVTLHSLSAYRRSEYALRADITLAGPAPALAVGLVENSDEYSQEFQINVDTERNKFVSGLYYMHEHIYGSNYTPINLIYFGGPDFVTQGYEGSGTLKTDAAAVYAQDTYNLTDALHLTLGGRYSWERKAIDDALQFDLTRPYSPGNPNLSPRHIDHRTWGDFTPKVGIDMDIAPQTIAYASFSKGFKSGTYNIGAAAPPLKPEKVTSYEAGLKSTLDGGRLRANIAAFRYDYSDLQVGKVQNNQLVLENAATARIYGVEGEFTVKPIEGAPLVLSVNPAWLRARFTQYVTADPARPAGDGVTTDPATGAPEFNLRGNTLVMAPDYTVSASAEYTFDIGRSKLAIRGESSWVGRTWFTPFNRPVSSQAPYNLQNLYAIYTDSNDHWHVTAFVKNIDNRTIEAASQVATGIIGFPIVGFVYPPRTYGATIGYRF